MISLVYIIFTSSQLAGVIAPYSISTILTNGIPWQLSVAVGIPLFVGGVLFTSYAKPSDNYDGDAATIYSTQPPMYEALAGEVNPRADELREAEGSR